MVTKDKLKRPQPVRRRKLYEQVTNELLDYIQSNKLQPGDQLPSERELMSWFEVGRPTVREALQHLERLGFVTISHGERARISNLDFGRVFEQMGVSTQYLLNNSDKMMAEMKEARLLFEEQMVRRAAKIATDEDVAELRALVDNQGKAKDDGDAVHFMGIDMAFHTRVAAVGGNSVYPAVSMAILSWLQKFYIDQLRASGTEALTVTEHHAIVDAIEQHDPDAAAAALSTHLNRSNALYQRLTKQ